jgi:competence protein ComEC
MLFSIAVAVTAGVAAGHGRPQAAWPALIIALTAIGGLTAGHRHPLVATVAALVAVAAGVAASAAWRSSNYALLAELAPQRAVVRVCGSVTDRGPHSVEVSVHRVQVQRRSWSVAEPLRLSGEGSEQLRPGERVCAVGTLHSARPGRNDPPLLRADRIDEHGIASPIRLAAGIVRTSYSNVARRALPARQAGLLLGMTDGDTAMLDPATVDDFRATGLAHIVAVSGYNVAVFLTLVMLFVRRVVRRGRWLRVACVVPALVFFAFVTGLQPSVLRASVSAGVALAVGADGRTADALRAAALAFVVLVMISPDMLFQIGFQLSFGATLGILIWSAPLGERLAKLFPNPSSRAAQAMSSGFGTTLAAQLSVAPLLAWHFGRVPGVGSAANLVAIPIAGLIMIGGLATLSAASLIPFLDWTPATMRLPLDAILGAAHLFARMPGATMGMSVLIGSAITAVLAAVLARSQRLRVGAVALVVLCAAASAGRALAASGVECPEGEIRALDVGMGTAVLVRAHDHAVLMDGGPPGAGVVRQLGFLHVKRLDAIVASHPHRDHVEGFVDVLAHVRVGRVIGPVITGWGMGAKLVTAARRAHVPLQTAAAGDTFDAGPIHLDVMAPEPGPAPDVEQPDLVNGYSLLVRATIGEVSVIAPGDLQAAEQSKVLESNLRAPILVAPHHGSANLDPEFVAAVAPRLVLVTVGAQNPYGLPSAKALAVFSRYGPVMRTDAQGTVTVCLHGGSAQVWTQKDEPVKGSTTTRGPRTPEVFG